MAHRIPIARPLDLTNFEEGRHLGGGSFGDVFEYRWNGRQDQHNPLQTDVVAVKIIDNSDSEGKAKKELKIAAKLRHVNIVFLHGWFEDSQRLHLVMELCNESLKTHLVRSKKRIEEKPMILFSLQLANGLLYLHSQDCAHRDLKPENILLEFPSSTDPRKNYKTVTLKLCDFGMARWLVDSSTPKSIVGNKKYAAPEIIRMREQGLNEGRYDAKAADVFSLGAVFYYMMSGNVPFTQQQLAKRKRELGNQDQLPENIPIQKMRPLLVNMFEWDRRQRYQMSQVVGNSFLEKDRKKIGTVEIIKNKMKEVIVDPVVQRNQASIGVATNHTLIVLVGPSGAGKTSTILHLMGQKDVEKSAFALSNRTSKTRETFELRLKLHSNNDPDLEHITLGIVDTPGLDDTKGKDQDARNMACMETFLNTHPSLKSEKGVRKYPNLVLFVIKGDGNRDIGKNSQFAQALQQLLCDDLHLTDGKNLIIVLTHAQSMELNPLKWRQVAQDKKQAIQNFVFKVKGWMVPVVLLDNDPPPSMKKAKDWTIFSDGTKQPLNLFECIADEILGRKGDLIGKRAIREYFQGVHDRDISSKVAHKTKATKTTKKNTRNQMEEKYYKYLKHFEFPPSSNEGSSDDDESADNDSGDSSGELDQGGTASGVVAMTKSNQLEDDRKLSEVDLLPRPHDRQQEDVAADVSEDEEFLDADSSEPRMPLFDQRHIGISRLLLGYNIEDQGFSVEQVFENHVEKYFQAMSENRSACVGTKSKEQLKSMTAYEIASQVNVTAVTVEVVIARVEVADEHNAFWLKKAAFRDEFVKDLNKLAKLRYHPNVTHVKKPYEEFFKKYGQAVVTSSRVGGRATISFSRNSSDGVDARDTDTSKPMDSPPSQLKDLLKGQFGVKEMPDIRLFYSDEPFLQVADSGNAVDIDFFGGDGNKQTPEMIDQWRKSLTTMPEYLIDEKTSLLRFHDLVSKLQWLEKRQELASNLRFAYEDLYCDGRIEVTEKDEAKDAGVMREIYAAKDDKEKTWFAGIFGWVSGK